MNVLFIGDIVGRVGKETAFKALRQYKKEYPIDLVIANGENIAERNGITPNLYHELIFLGVDVVTLGNHSWARREIFQIIDEATNLVRPFNYPKDTPGRGYTIVECKHQQAAVISLMGNVFLSTLQSPFEVIDELLEQLKGANVKYIIIDFHGEATSEKIAFGRYLDGRVSAVIGTHTHVQTADEKILPHKTAYITDVGMTGPYDSVLGIKVEGSVKRFRTQLPAKFEQADAPGQFNGVLLSLDETTGLAKKIERLQFVDL